MAKSKAGKESLIMRKQGYVIIGIGLAMLVGIFWLAQFSKEETPTAAEPTVIFFIKRMISTSAANIRVH